MGDAWRNPPRRSAADDLLRILSTSISIFDSAITLLGEPSSGGVQMPGARAYCLHKEHSEQSRRRRRRKGEFTLILICQKTIRSLPFRPRKRNTFRPGPISRSTTSSYPMGHDLVLQDRSVG